MTPLLLAVVLAGSDDDAAEHQARREEWQRLAQQVKASLRAPDEPCAAYEDGKRFSVCFDPWKGLELGGGAVFSTDGWTGSFVAGARFRGSRESRSKEESTWFDLHRVGVFELRGVQGQPAMHATLWNGYFRRHVAEGVLLVPTTPPVRIPFPLDIALAADVLTWERRVAEGNDWALEPLRLAVLLDPLRASTSRFHLGVGALAGYRLRQVSGALVHDLTPLTAATLFVDVESEDGLWVLRATATAGWTFSPGAMGGTFRARGEVDGARVLLALNDQPVSVFVHASGAWADAGARAGSEVVVTAGLRLQLLSSR
jgi:hypothetical protein